ncbi:MAG: hypothetical protein ACOX8R_00525 [Bacillota bacterium]|jgi:hypothetical protein
MATQSIFSNVKIKNRTMSKNFVDALENAKGKTAKEVIPSKKCETVKDKETILKIFGERDERV